jgi:hypothetical protein
MARKVGGIDSPSEQQLVDERIEIARAGPAPAPWLAGDGPFDVERDPHGVILGQ